jgi:hypothetical protein
MILAIFRVQASLTVIACDDSTMFIVQTTEDIFDINNT